VTLLHREGYFQQHIDELGHQSEEPYSWLPQELLELQEVRASLTIEGRTVYLKAWEYIIFGADGHQVPVYFLDTKLQENGAFDQTLTGSLYGGGTHYRLCQEVLLGMGGVGYTASFGMG
jgi:starch phosphorylase